MLQQHLSLLHHKIKNDMQVLQNKILRIIVITREEFRYKIQDVSYFLERNHIAQVSRILNVALHSLPTSIKTTRRTRSYFPFNIPSVKTNFNDKAVMVTLRHPRDNVYKRTKPLQPKASTQ